MNNFEYKIINGEAVVTKHIGKELNIVIPSEINGLPVTTIGNSEWIFTRAESVSFSDSVTTIEKGAFSLSTIKFVDIPDTLINIGESAFTTCFSLVSVNVSPNNKNYSSVDGVLFNKDKTVLLRYPPMKKGSAYVVPKGVKVIADDAFDHCNLLKSIELPDSVTSIGERAFLDTSITAIKIPNGVTDIKRLTFYYCVALKTAEIPDSVTHIGENAFECCKSLEYLKINGVTTVEKNAFEKCSRLAYVTIGDGLKTINESVFDECRKLVSVAIPDGVTDIHPTAFRGCPKKAVIYCNPGSYAEQWAKNKKFSCEFTPQPDFAAPVTASKISKKYYWQFCDEYSGTEKAIYIVSKSFWEHNHCLDDQLQTVFELDVLGFDCLAEGMYGCPDGMTKKEIRELLSDYPCFKEKKMF